VVVVAGGQKEEVRTGPTVLEVATSRRPVTPPVVARGRLALSGPAAATTSSVARASVVDVAEVDAVGAAKEGEVAVAARTRCRSSRMRRPNRLLSPLDSLFLPSLSVM
jgi:hypothetical protein